MLFWTVTIAMALGACVILGAPLRRGRSGPDTGEDAPAAPAAYDLRVYRDQLREVDRDRARGVLGEGEAERLRTEVSRRILATDARLQQGGGDAAQPKNAGRALILAALALLVGGSALLYVQLGAPGYADLPLKARIAASDAARAALPAQAALEATMQDTPPVTGVTDEYRDLMDKLRSAVAENPDDLRGLTLLARNEAMLGNTRAARIAQTQVIALKGDAVSDIDHVFHADLMITAAGGIVSGEAETALRAALALNPQQETARYYLGLFLMQVDRPDSAFRVWEALLRDSPPDAPWVPGIRTQLEDVAARAGVRYTLPAAPTLPGPDAEAIAAAADMSPEERQEFAQSMVTQLSERLASDGGSAREWSRLVTVYGVLGETAKAREAHDKALGIYAANPDAVALIRAAGARAGITPQTGAQDETEARE